MKIAILHGPRDLRIEEWPLDTDNLKPDKIWVETEISALKIGTDRGNYEGAEQVPGAPDYPRGVGDSNLGVVRGVGSAVTRFQVGDRVASSQFHQAAYIINESDHVVKVPDGVHSEDAVYANLYGLSAHCYRKTHFQPGENVAVVGLGVLGLGAVALGPLFGARVVGIGNSPIRLEMAERMGLTPRTCPTTPTSKPNWTPLPMASASTWLSSLRIPGLPIAQRCRLSDQTVAFPSSVSSDVGSLRSILIRLRWNGSIIKGFPSSR